jgi:hypothetical protein
MFIYISSIIENIERESNHMEIELTHSGECAMSLS